MTTFDPNQNPSNDPLRHVAPANPFSEGGARPPGPPGPAGSPRGARAWTPVAWILIILTTLGLFWMNNFVEMPEGGSGGGADEADMGVVLMKIQGQYMVGTADLDPTAGEVLLPQADEMLNIGTVAQRQRYVILASELGGVEAGAAAVDQLDGVIEIYRDGPNDPKLTAEQSEIQSLLRRLYPMGTATTDSSVSDDDLQAGLLARVEDLSQTERDLLVDKLGWFGRLALAPKRTDAAARDAVVAPTRAVVFGFVGALIVGCIAGFLGLIGLIVLVVCAATGRVRSRMTPGAGRHGLYAETFAIWLLVFITIQIPIGFVAMLFPESTLFLLALGFFASLGVLAWPVLRGIPWSDVRQDIGWTTGKGVVLETGVGVAGYLLALPLLGAGVALTFVLLLVQAGLAGAEADPFAPAGGPAHPIILSIGGPGLWPKIQLFLVASIAAPVVEETMFRGVLYRHLRDLSRPIGTALSAILSGAVSGVIFAAIHPQGWVAIPALAGLAYGFVLVREWRGTVWPAMVVHGVSNGLVMSLLVFVLTRG